MNQGSLLLRLACGVLPAIAAWGQQYTINTFAGNQSLGAGYGGDNQAATSDQLNGPIAAAVDANGNIYIADALNHRVRKVSGGTITTIAGTGTAGYTGDGTAANTAELNTPSGVAVDSAGNVYIADTQNNVIRKVGTDGKISTYAGNASLGPGFGGDNNPPNSAGAQFSKPIGLAFDPSGNLYIADSGNNLVRKVKSDGSLLTTAVGQGLTIQTLNNPVALAVDPTGSYMYIADLGGKRIARFQFSNNAVTTLAGNGSSGYSPDGPISIGTALNNAAGVATDAAGNVYIADTVNSLIRVVTPNGASGYLTTIAGHVLSGGRPIPGFSGDGGPATSAQVNSPKGLAIDKSGNVYVADTGNNIVRILQPNRPSIANGGIGNAFSFKTQISPGAAASIFGTGLATTSSTPSAPLPVNVGGVTVTVNGQFAPLYYISSGQINFQVPWETGTGTASVVVSANGLASSAASVQVVSAGPGLNQYIQNYPAYSINSSTNPIPAGGTIIAYVTGSGPVSPSQNDGALPGSSNVNVTSTCTATIGSQNAVVGFCGLQPNSVGLVQVNITVPSGLSTGTYPLTISINGQASNSQNVSVN
ncbi:MAG TPA: hypothetical protein VKB88_13375 [Bryobacteraceae bacterium]|nr:hypothetical protein [Bryobacteraceae bacterium]